MHGLNRCMSIGYVKQRAFSEPNSTYTRVVLTGGATSVELVREGFLEPISEEQRTVLTGAKKEEASVKTTQSDSNLGMISS